MKLNTILILIAIICLTVSAYNYGYNDAYIEPVSPTFWIDNECYSRDATVHPTDLHNELGEIIGKHVMIRDDRGDAFITFTDKDYATWQEDFTSWSMAFREGAKQ